LPLTRRESIQEGFMKKVLLSDIDGTLVDSNCLHAESWRRTFEHFGIEVGLDEAWSQIGKGGDQLIPVFVPRRSASDWKTTFSNFGAI
jgi:beta-phosphoglucomutase-like phosphatase (HAD superfamily)